MSSFQFSRIPLYSRSPHPTTHIHTHMRNCASTFSYTPHYVAQVIWRRTQLDLSIIWSFLVQVNPSYACNDTSFSLLAIWSDQELLFFKWYYVPEGKTVREISLHLSFCLTKMEVLFVMELIKDFVIQREREREMDRFVGSFSVRWSTLPGTYRLCRSQ